VRRPQGVPGLTREPGLQGDGSPQSHKEHEAIQPCIDFAGLHAEARSRGVSLAYPLAREAGEGRNIRVQRMLRGEGPRAKGDIFPHFPRPLPP